jgi:sugar-specific transcriptional regulator TrmB
MLTQNNAVRFGKLGYSEKESRVYLASLEIGPTSVQNIAKKADVKRVTTHAVLNVLMKRGLIEVTTVGKKRMYAATSPEILLTHLRAEKMNLEMKERILDELLHEFMIGGVIRKGARKTR